MQRGEYLLRNVVKLPPNGKSRTVNMYNMDNNRSSGLPLSQASQAAKGRVSAVDGLYYVWLCIVAKKKMRFPFCQFKNRLRKH